MIQVTGNVAMVSGPITMSTASALLVEGCDAINGAAKVFDLSSATDVDSAGLALLFAWLREARTRSVDLQFCNLPASLESLAAVYDLVDLLPKR